jgi:alkane 1-monooxygenase
MLLSCRARQDALTNDAVNVDGRPQQPTKCYFYAMHWKAVKFCLPSLLYGTASAGFLWGGAAVWFTPILAFCIIPALELLLQPSTANLSAAEEEMAKNDRLYDALLYAIAPLQYGSLLLFLYTVAQKNGMGPALAGQVVSMGILCGVFGINVGHELGHRQHRFEQLLAKSLLLTSLYTHFFIEHNKGHHKHVATPHDPSSAPYRMWLYHFHLRSIWGVYLGAWRIAAADLKAKGLRVLHYKNEMLQLQLLTLAFLVAIGAAFGWMALLCFFGAAAVGAILLETVNYIEHYGLQRRQRASGQYERAQPHHSWNSNHPVGRLMLFELTRHSDHHYLASRKYQVLRHHAEAPQLPTGYPGSMLLAALPPLWFWVMDRQMKKYNLHTADNA